MAEATTVAEQINNVVDHIADKLHVPVTHLWEVLVRQARAQVIIDVGMVGLGVGMAIVYGKVLRRLIERWAKAKEEHGQYSDKSEAAGACALAFGVGGGILVLVVLFAAIVSLPEMVTCLVNPEYWALQQVVRGVK